VDSLKDWEDVFVLDDDWGDLDEGGGDEGAVEVEREPFVAGVRWGGGDVAGEFDVVGPAAVEPAFDVGMVDT
jgi:hypothetical protein